MKRTILVALLCLSASCAFAEDAGTQWNTEYGVGFGGTTEHLRDSGTSRDVTLLSGGMHALIEYGSAFGPFAKVGFSYVLAGIDSSGPIVLTGYSVKIAVDTLIGAAIEARWTPSLRATAGAGVHVGAVILGPQSGSPDLGTTSAVGLGATADLEYAVTPQYGLFFGGELAYDPIVIASTGAGSFSGDFAYGVSMGFAMHF